MGWGNQGQHVVHTQTRNKIMVLMGPTGSGKSAMALAIAASRPAVIINADAMQMVDALRVLTARPTVAEEAMAEHALYGVLPPSSPTSVAVWLGLVKPVIEQAWAQGKLPLLVGGTGMYIKTLMDGLAAVPEIPPAIRASVRAMERAKLHPHLTMIDPLMATQLKPGDTQRLLRAIEVMEATGKSLEYWKKQALEPFFPEAEFTSYYMDMSREEMYARIDKRFEIMINTGALDEVRMVMALNLPPDLPILRAHGVPELAAHLCGEMTLEDAIKKSQQNTRNYAKRQMTWIRNQLSDAVPVQSGDGSELSSKRHT